MNAIGKAIASLGVASSLYHASQTKFGHLYDDKVIDLILWVIHQEAIKKLDTIIKALNVTPSILFDLSDEPRQIFYIGYFNSQ